MAAKPRVHEVASELGIDARAALRLLADLGEVVRTPSSTIEPPVARKLRRAVEARITPTQNSSAADPKAFEKHISPPSSTDRRRPRRKTRVAQTPSPAAKAYRLHGQARERFRQAFTALIPDVYAAVTNAAPRPDASVIVICSRTDAPERHWVCTMDGEPVENVDPAVLRPIRDLYEARVATGQVPPSQYLGLDLEQSHAWVARSLKAAKRRAFAVDAESLAPVKPDWRQAMIAPSGWVMEADEALWVKAAVGTLGDQPEETFLISDDLLHLAVDSVSTAPHLMPVPVHTNAVWVFARPVIMTLPGGAVRGVRAIWFRQGGTMWRLRTYAGHSTKFSQVGAQLSGRTPFVPLWDAGHPEQQVLAAVWALMAQGGVAEAREQSTQTGAPHPTSGRQRRSITIVDVKPGTPHARHYGSRPTPESDRPAWSVRGHWRRQPYPSLGVDENGDVRTQMIWIATYTKGSPEIGPAPQKVLRVSADRRVRCNSDPGGTPRARGLSRQ